MKTIILSLAVLFSVATAEAASVKIPALYACMGSAGTITVRQKCKAGELKLTAQNLNSQGATGAQGPAGPQGPKGLLNLPLCRSLGISAFDDDLNGYTFGTLICAQGEFLLIHGVSTTGSIPVINDQTLVFNGNLAVGISVIAGADFPSTFAGPNILVTGVCCPAS